MNLIDIILSTEVIAGIIIVASLAYAVRSILFFTREASTMGPRLQRIEADLNRLRDGMDEKRRTVKALTVTVDPLRLRESRLRSYYDSLKNLELEYDRRVAESSAREEEERVKRIQKKKMGL
ncbi:MAG: hypothetical protein ABIL09_21165 [Gemmatimonadota bacterium]